MARFGEYTSVFGKSTRFFCLHGLGGGKAFPLAHVSAYSGHAIKGFRGINGFLPIRQAGWVPSIYSTSLDGEAWLSH